MAEHFIGMERLLEILRLTKFMDDPVDVIAELESEDVHKDKRPEKKRGRESSEKPKHVQSEGGQYQPIMSQQGTKKKGRGRR
jgi:archaea-specific helicase